MADYASGSLRIPGLSNSSVDFEDMITKLTNIEARQVTQLLQWKSDWQARIDAFKQLRGELMNLQTTLNSLNSMDKFLVKSTSSSEEKVATAVADYDAMNASYEVEVGRLATYSTWTRETGLYEKSDVISVDGGEFTYSYKGTYRTVSVPKGTTVEGLLKIINNDSKNPGVRAQLIQSADGIAFQLRGMDTGQSNTLVIRSTTGITGLDVQLSTDNYEDGENWAKCLTDFASPTDLINTTGETKTFIYTIDSKRYVIDVETTDTLDSLIQKINDKTPGVASHVLENGAYHLQLEKEDTSYSLDLTGATDLEAFLNGSVEFGPNETIRPSLTQAETWTFTLNSSDGSSPTNRTLSVEVDNETTLTTLAESLRQQIGSQGEIKIVQGSAADKFTLEFVSTDKVHRLTVENGSLESLTYTPPTAVDGTWDVQHAQNAQVRINGYPKADAWMEVASNTLKSGEVIPGMTFTLLKAGESTTISVSNDTAKMQENIETFVDAVNSFRTLLMELTKYDESKQTYDPDYAESLFEMQKGAVLTGNYGVQMVGSRLKNTIAASAVGFQSLLKDVDGSILGGDVFSSLSQIGITTNATEGEATYGLLEINYMPGQYGSKSLAQALSEDPEAVARLFATKSEGKSNSDYFHYDSHISTVTESGTYTVQYTMSADGSTIESATINGQSVLIDQENFLITSNEGPAKGLAIKVANDTGGQTFTGTVSIRDGKINELLSLLEGTEGMLGSNGTLRNLEKNYEGIIDGIDEKIKREDDRLQRFEDTMILKFARLEEVLQKYSGLQSTLEAQLAQLNTSSS